MAAVYRHLGRAVQADRSVRAAPISYEVVSSLPIRARGIPETA
jgi:hypothetical protein